MLLPTILNSLNAVSKEHLVSEILELNDELRGFGLMLNPKQAIQILEVRNRTLEQVGRIELGIGVTKSIIRSFAASSYITREEYVLTLNELHEIFYYMKNETEDKLSDEELIAMMKDSFENSCGGSLELVKSKLTTFAQDFRKKLASELT